MDSLELTAVVLAAVAVVLLSVSFALPPKGEISPSVLQASAILLAFNALFFAWYSVKHGRKAHFSFGNVQTKIERDDDKNQ